MDAWSLRIFLLSRRREPWRWQSTLSVVFGPSTPQLHGLGIHAAFITQIGAPPRLPVGEDFQ